MGAAVREWRPINVPDVRKDPRYLPMNPETRSELIVPLFYKGRVIGVLDLEHTRAGFFNEEHERMLTTLAAQVAIAIENARLYQAVRRQERQLERDIAMAREVQLRLLPPDAPSHPHAEMAVRFLPARTIGGDLYDFLDYGPNRTAIVLGDVSGKAAPAALFAALVSGIMRSAALQQPEPAQMLALLNDALQERKLESQYVTMLFALWNDENQTLQVANSGAVQPVFCRAGQSMHRQGRGISAGHVPRRHLRGIQRRHAARRRHRLRLRRHSRCGERQGRDVRRGAARPACSAPAATSPPTRSPTPSSPTSPASRAARPLRRRNHHRPSRPLVIRSVGLRFSRSAGLLTGYSAGVRARTGSLPIAESRGDSMSRSPGSVFE